MHHDDILKTYDSDTGKTYVLQPSKQTTEADITDIHNLIAQLLVDDYMDTHTYNISGKQKDHSLMNISLSSRQRVKSHPMN
ncbi:hypothetical protein CIG75_17835 [Tumebacillus algifaecis]|uniref:Uncharacterized protein n=1 Tax=Tumebacillus algifaecis TaxID=1214604 RepID=A0A223D5F5_9BACL|nr:hypothetical protein CIG75_17835 [Tumebacillus algifaecis]